MVSPFIGAIAAGNCTILKPAEQAAATADVIAEIVEAVFPPEYAAVCRGGHEVTRELLAEEFDYIFYTGGTAGGKLVARSAAEHFTPTTLELGGKNPCIVDDDAKIDLAAKRIVWGKFLNAGQTCCAPDYILAHRSLRDALIERMKHWITAFYGDDPRISPDFPRIISSHHCERLAGLMNGSEILCGGTVSIEERYVAPTILVPASNDAPVMGEEIFGPLLPVLTVDSPDEAVAFVAKRPKPLALYYFSNGRKHLDSVLAMTSSGGVCVNETIMHFINPDMPFGGVGASGHGAYHGKRSFDTFTHYKPVMLKSNLIDLPTRYPPNLDGKLKMLDMMGM
jgi:aldehyde dehydrogenase (NAD+)